MFHKDFSFQVKTESQNFNATELFTVRNMFTAAGLQTPVLTGQRQQLSGDVCWTCVEQHVQGDTETD